MEEFLIINRFEEYCYSREMMGRIEEVLKRWIQFYSPSTLITVCSYLEIAFVFCEDRFIDTWVESGSKKSILNISFMVVNTPQFTRDLLQSKL